MKEIETLLSSCPLFAGIDLTQLEGLLGCLGAQRKLYTREETVMLEGAPATHLGVVLSGAVEVLRTDYDGNRSMIAHVAPGELFAEAFACADASTLPVHVVACEEASVLLIQVSRILHSCREACDFHQKLIYNLMRILARKNLQCQQKLDVLSRRSTRDKLLTYLRTQAKQTGSATFTIPWDRQALADYLAVERSGLSSEISKLRREGVLACERNRFTLLRSEE